MKHQIEFNNGFITAIALFLEHKNAMQLLPKDKEGKLITDLRLYGATDHLYDLEIPKGIDNTLKKLIIKWRDECFHNRLAFFKTTEVSNRLFEEAENILAEIDRMIFKTKKVVMRCR
jgi:hypothetical protein